MCGAVSQFTERLHDVVLIKHRHNFYVLPYAYFEECIDYFIPNEFRTRYLLLRYLLFTIYETTEETNADKNENFLRNGTNAV
jgi:hypothetical protein